METGGSSSEALSSAATFDSIPIPLLSPPADVTLFGGTDHQAGTITYQAYDWNTKTILTDTSLYSLLQTQVLPLLAAYKKSYTVGSKTYYTQGATVRFAQGAFVFNKEIIPAVTTMENTRWIGSHTATLYLNVPASEAAFNFNRQKNVVFDGLNFDFDPIFGNTSTNIQTGELYVGSRRALEFNNVEDVVVSNCRCRGYNFVAIKAGGGVTIRGNYCTNGQGFIAIDAGPVYNLGTYPGAYTNDIVISDNDFVQCYDDFVDLNPYNGIAIARRVRIINNRFRQLYWDAAAIDNSSYGNALKLADQGVGTSSFQEIIFKGNSLYNFPYGRAIKCLGGSIDVTIDGNEFVDCGTGMTPTALSINDFSFAAIHLGNYTHTRMIISNNIFRRTARAVFYEGASKIKFVNNHITEKLTIGAAINSNVPDELWRINPSFQGDSVSATFVSDTQRPDYLTMSSFVVGRTGQIQPNFAFQVDAANRRTAVNPPKNMALTNTFAVYQPRESNINQVLTQSSVKAVGQRTPTANVDSTDRTPATFTGQEAYGYYHRITPAHTGRPSQMKIYIGGAANGSFDATCKIFNGTDDPSTDPALSNSTVSFTVTNAVATTLVETVVSWPTDVAELTAGLPYLFEITFDNPASDAQTAGMYYHANGTRAYPITRGGPYFYEYGDGDFMIGDAAFELFLLPTLPVAQPVLEIGASMPSDLSFSSTNSTNLQDFTYYRYPTYEEIHIVADRLHAVAATANTFSIDFTNRTRCFQCMDLYVTGDELDGSTEHGVYHSIGAAGPNIIRDSGGTTFNAGTITVVDESAAGWDAAISYASGVVTISVKNATDNRNVRWQIRLTLHTPPPLYVMM